MTEVCKIGAAAMVCLAQVIGIGAEKGTCFFIRSFRGIRRLPRPQCTQAPLWPTRPDRHSTHAAFFHLMLAPVPIAYDAYHQPEAPHLRQEPSEVTCRIPI